MRIACIGVISLVLATSLNAQRHVFPPGFLDQQTLGKPPVALAGRVWYLKFSSDGQRLFAVANKVYDVDWRRKIPRVIWEEHDNETMMRASFSPDGSLFARLNNGDKIDLHESSTGKVLYTIKRQERLTVLPGWARDKDLIAIADRKQILIHHPKTGALVRKISQGQTDIMAVALSPDGKLLVAGNNRVDKNQEEGFLLYHLDGDAPPVRLPGNATSDHCSGAVLSFSPDSKILAVYCSLARSETLYFWDVAEHKLIYQLGGRGYNFIAHSPDGSLLAAGGLNNLEILDARTGREVFRHQGESVNEHIWSVAFSPDGNTLATGIEDHIKFWDTRTWKQIDPDPNLSAPPSALAFSSDGRHLVTGSLAGEMVLWDWEKKSVLWKSPSPQGQWPINALSVDPSNTMIGVQQQPRYGRGQVRIVDFATGEIRRFLSPPSPTFAEILFRSDQKTALIATANQILQWDVVADRLIKAIPVPFLHQAQTAGSFEIRTLRADPADPDLIWWTAQSLFGAIHLERNTEACTFELSKDFRISAPIPPRGHEFVNIGDMVWNLPTRHLVNRANSSNLPSVRHPYGNLLFIGGYQGKVLVFDIMSQSVIREIDFGPGEIKALTLTPDGKTLVAATTGGVHYVSLTPVNLPAGTTSATLWQLMGSDDHWQAWLAAWALARQSDFIPFLTNHLTPAAQPAPAELRLLQSLLTDGSDEVRQTAARKLLDLGHSITPETYETLRQDGLPTKLPEGPPPGFPDCIPSAPVPVLVPLSEHRRAMRAVMILQEDATAPAVQFLKLLAGGDPGSPVTVACQKVLAALAIRQ